MTEHFHITPPPELVQQWIAEIWHEGTPVQVAQSDLHLADRAAQWGYEQRGEVNEVELQQARDQELEACTAWLRHEYGHAPEVASKLRAVRRPKPPSLKEQALEQLDGIATVVRAFYGGDLVCDTIRRALEALPDD